MSSQANATLTATLSALLQNIGLLGTSQLPLNPQLLSMIFTNGAAAANKINQVYQAQTTVANASHNDLDLYALGAVNDAVGNPFTMAVIKVLIFQNLSSTPLTPLETDDLTLGGQGTTAAWTSFFGTNTDTIKVRGGGTLIIADPGAAGYVVGASTTNHLLRIGNATANTITYNLYILGATS